MTLTQSINQVDSSTSTLWACSFPKEWVSGYLLLLYFVDIPVFNANCVDLDQTPHSHLGKFKNG